MKRAFGCVLLGLSLVLSAMPASAQSEEDAAKKKKANDHHVYRAWNNVIDTSPLRDSIPFAKFLDVLAEQMEPDNRISFRLDRDAFGKDADKMLKDQVVLPRVPTKMVVHTVTRLVLQQVNSKGYEIEFKSGPGELIITTRDRSMYTVTYDIRELLKHTRYLHEEMKAATKRWVEDGSWQGGCDLKADPDKAEAWIVRQVIASTDAERAGWHGRKPASTIQVRNGGKLVVHTAPSVHASIDGTLSWFLRWAGVAVVMDAKLYAVERAFYDEQVAPLFVNPKNKAERRPVARASEALVNKLAKQKPILESEFDKLRPYDRAGFLSLQNVYHYLAHADDAQPTTAFAGVSFTVRPLVSADRRSIRLEFEQEANVLVKMAQRTVVDPKTGKVSTVETPTVKKNSMASTFDIWDGQAIVLSVDYPAEKGKVLVLLASPRIYIEEEEERIREEAMGPESEEEEEAIGNGAMEPEQAPENPAPGPPPLPEPPEPTPVELANTAHVKQILHAVVGKMMLDPKLRGPRNHNGTLDELQYALIDSKVIAWPKAFRPEIPAYKLVDVDPDEPTGFQTRLLGLKINSFSLTRKQADGTEAVIEIEMINAGGSINGYGGNTCVLECRAKRVDGRWIIQYEIQSPMWLDARGVGRAKRLEAAT